MAGAPQAAPQRAFDEMDVYSTEDGYTFYRQPDGTFTDNRDPDLADMVFEDFDELREGDLGLLPGEFSERGDLAKRRGQQILDDWFAFMEGPLDDGVLYQRALNRQRGFNTPGLRLVPDPVDEAVPAISTTQSGTGTLEGALGPHKSQLAVEYDEGIIGAYNDAHGTDYEARSVFDLDPEEVKGSDLFHSSPVCKNLSCAKRGRAINEDDQKMADKVVEVVQGARPPAVTIENVPGYEKTVLFDEIMDALDAEGYSVDAQVVDAADYGGAQHRSRLIIRASRDGEVPPLPEPTGPSDWFETIEDLIDDAPDMPFRGRSKADEGWEIKRLRQDIADGRLDPEKPIITMGGSADSKHAYAANAGGPSPTITSTAGSVPRIVMPDGRVKRVTGRMLARLMGLPDDFKIPENWGQAKKVLGNGIHGEITRQMIAPMAEIGRRSNKGK